MHFDEVRNELRDSRFDLMDLIPPQEINYLNLREYHYEYPRPNEYFQIMFTLSGDVTMQ